MPYRFLQIDHYETSPVAGRSDVFARARFQDPETLAEITQEFRFPTLVDAQANAQRYAEAYLPQLNGIDIALQEPAVESQRIISKIEFLKRFGDANMIAVLTAAKTVPAIEAWVFWFQAAIEIHLDDEPKVTEGIQALISFGLIDGDTLNRVLA